ncbi:MULTISPECIES: TIGR00296 family protein [Acidianus]|uniref:Protein CM19_08795 n=1 Tax=Candidatus Acidianus copahuensis TaxID=1160895 RepID=A0A031LM37_9CREN|nr:MULTISPECIES: TIGR00296 family protein [Acidianus]EZQ03812.1 hypothetical protein CM19_08795 [Candidatus Acidianus copahuensis]NON63381.1 TIGR00296 family protein [Acidianus sp. RZ1]
MSSISIQELDLERGKILVKLARRAIERKLRLSNNDILVNDPIINKRGLAFVTIESFNGITYSLRGCIGYVQAVAPLKDIVQKAAVAAAFSDPRFPPISKEEFKELVIEVTVLTEPEEVYVNDRFDLPKMIKVGRDGLIVEKGIMYSGLLLPQVPKEYCWDEETFLAETCVKAGLSPDCWLMNEVKIRRFYGVIFREKYPGSEDILMKSPDQIKCKKSEEILE